MSELLDRLARRSAAVLRVVAAPVSPAGVGGDGTLIAQLQACLDARALIPSESERARELADAAENETERLFRLWQGEVEAAKIERAALCAGRRLSLLDSLKSEGDYARERDRCAGADGSVYWFGMYAWGYDPRSLLKVQPFDPFEYQERYIRWLDESVFRRRTSGLVEKSRDMGATVGALDWIAKCWLFVPGFSAFLVSANEDLVDSKADPDTLFEKVRFQLRLTPSWMLPEGFDLLRDMPYMNIANPANGATISGGAPTENAGRQRRATVVLADEFQSWPGGGFKQNTSLSQTSNSVLKLGTPMGMQNQYAVDAHTPGVNKFVMDWRERPWKSRAWFDSLPFGYGASPMTAESIAQEINRDFNASQPGKVFKNWHEREPYVLITWAELVAFYEQAGMGLHFVDPETGEYRVPFDWNWGRMQDYGQTEAHKWIITHGARPRENYPLSDSFFVFGYIVAPTGAAVGEVQPLIEAQQNRLGLAGAPELSQMSHEQCGVGGVAETFMEEHGEFWEAWSTDYNVGIPQIQEWLMLVDQTKPNPIRPALAGRTRLYFVCADEIRLAYNPRSREHFVTPSKSEAGFKLARAEMHSYHYPLEEMGKAVQLMRPEKKKGMDNFVDTLRGFGTRWGPSVAPMTQQERRTSKLPEQLRPAHVLSRVGQPDFVELTTAAQHAMHRIRRAEERVEEERSKNLARFLGRPVSHRRYRGSRN